MNHNKIYQSQAFVNKIQMNLAQVSANPEDEFTLVNAYYDPKTFDCELCGHKNVMYAYEVKNVKTEKVLKVGSKCVQHFKDKGIDINLAEALMKRVMSATNKARRDLKYKLGTDAWGALSDEERKKIGYKHWQWIDEKGKELYKALSKEEKRTLIVNQFMIIQAKELLIQVSLDKHYLTEEEIENIANLGLQDDIEKANKRADAVRLYKK